MSDGVKKWLLEFATKSVGTQRLHQAVSIVRRGELSRELSTRYNNRVLSGSFEGMILPSDASWSNDGDLIAKLIGSYESNIHEALQKGIQREPNAIVNVGCAEGYYAIGLARLAPKAKVYAFDIDDQAQLICFRSAEENGVADRVVVGGLCTTDTLTELIDKNERVFIVMDCEGAEVDLLDPMKVPGLSHCDILVETHDFMVKGTAETLEKRFEKSHDVDKILQAGRNPNGIKELAEYSESDRWLMVNEFRPAVMTWLACWSQPGN